MWPPKAIVRRHLFGLHVQVITPRPDLPNNRTEGFPALPSAVSTDGAAGSALGVSFRTGTGQLRTSRGGSRQRRGGGRRAKRKGGNGVGSTVDDRRIDSRSRCGRSHATGGGGGGSSVTSDDRCTTGGGLTEAVRSRGHSRGRKSGPDDATSWSEWQPTGIPSWDILVSQQQTDPLSFCSQRTRETCKPVRSEKSAA